MGGTAGLVADDRQVKAALPPLRRRLLTLLVDPASAAELARRTGIARQKINYHLRVLEDAGLVELVEARARRGCVERVLRATANELVVDPQLVSSRSDTLRSRDRYAAEHLSDVAAAAVRDVTRLRAGAERAAQRLLTFTLETEVTFAQPADVHAFTRDLADAMADLARRHGDTSGRRYRIIAGGHPDLTHPKREDTTE